MPTDSYAVFGGYRHDAWEMNLAEYTVHTRLSRRGKMITRIYRCVLDGEIISTTGPAGITTKLNQILTAYYRQNQDLEFYVDGDPTPHRLPSGLSISGTKVLEIAHLVGGAGQYNNRRNLRIVLQMEKEEPESQLIEWGETVKWIGTTGPRDTWYQGFLRPRRQRVCQRTVQTLVQSGYSVGWAGYVQPTGCMFPLLELQDRRIIVPGTPQNSGQALRMYPVQWTYSMATDSYTEGFPFAR